MQIFKTMEISEFCVLKKYCLLIGKNTVQAKQWLDKCYLDLDQLETMIKRWYVDFKHRHKWCSMQVAQIQQLSWKKKKLHKLALANSKLKSYEIAEELKISEGSEFTILHEHLSLRKLFSKWVLHLFTVDQKQQHIDDSECCLQLFQCKKKEFFA